MNTYLKTNRSLKVSLRYRSSPNFAYSTASEIRVGSSYMYLSKIFRVSGGFLSYIMPYVSVTGPKVSSTVSPFFLPFFSERRFVRAVADEFLHSPAYIPTWVRVTSALHSSRSSLSSSPDQHKDTSGVDLYRAFKTPCAPNLLSLLLWDWSADLERQHPPTRVSTRRTWARPTRSGRDLKAW